MDELLKILGNIAEKVGGEWKQKTMMDNDNGNPLVDAYNEGVHDMAERVCRYLSIFVSAKAGEKNG